MRYQRAELEQLPAEPVPRPRMLQPAQPHEVRRRPVLGHPAAAVTWPANTLAAFGTALEPGHLILPGMMTGAPFVDAGQQVETRLGGLGSVSVSVSVTVTVTVTVSVTFVRSVDPSPWIRPPDTRDRRFGQGVGMPAGRVGRAGRSKRAGTPGE
ncbi:hypothetical protein OG289_03315 [Streptomyces sp. NBC_01235]|nr:hypothetical protein OG289_03315 [Streptomyces sp. NBC_01235]